MRNLFFFFLLFASLNSYGNDTVANVVTGNITFKKSKEIIMESEELSISPSKISVKYSFKNDTTKPIGETVVFPLPASFSESGGWAAPEPESLKNTINFVLKVDGKSKPFQIHSKKEYHDKENDIYTIYSFYSWNQIFPAGKSLLVEHEYDTNPGSGGSVEFDDETKKKYCIDDSFLKAFEKMKPRIKKIAENEEDRCAPHPCPTPNSYRDLGYHLHYNSFSHVSYILTTANNWAGPIRNFKLRLKKDKPSTIVSLCWDGLIKKSDVDYESVKTNFSPTSELSILFVHER